jgi:hypothetical protein
MSKRQWKTLEEFPNYEVSNFGEFFNARTDREVHTSMTQQGHAKITLSKDGRLATRSAALLVANSFIEQPDSHFDTPIHLNGNLMDCAADNLMWRPRWFAIRYHRQFNLDVFHLDQGHRVELNSNEHYYSLKEACVRNGLYYYDVIKSCVEETFVPITLQEFRDVLE